MFRVVVSTLIIFSLVTSLSEAQTKKEPIVSLLLSVLVPGYGQFYNGQTGKGAIMLGTEIAPLVVVSRTSEDNVSFLGETIDVDGDDGWGAIIAFVWIGNRIWSAKNAYSSAKRLNLERGLTLNSARELCYPMCFRCFRI